MIEAVAASLLKVKRMKTCLFGLLFFLSLETMAEPAPAADMILSGGRIYTLNPAAPIVEAVAVKGDRILAAGSRKQVFRLRKPRHTRMIDLEGGTMTPGFIESHGHLLGLGYAKLRLDLNQVTSFDELIEQVRRAAENTPRGEWILGRGWHQSKWTGVDSSVKGFPVHPALSAVSRDHPVYLTHASGHAAMVNAYAMRLAGIDENTEFDESGEIIKDANGQPTGILNERAQYLVSRLIPPATRERDALALNAALNALAEHGITGFHDAGMSRSHLQLIQSYRDQGLLTARMYIMLSGRDESLMSEYFRLGPQIGDWVTVRAIKLVSDGALGSRGAWLTQPYSDRAEHYGNPTMPIAELYDWSKQAYLAGFQVCVHAIGDKANHEVLNQFERVLGDDRSRRFRIEHAQHLLPQDIPRFAELQVVAAMQAIHMSSDRPWAIDRLGRTRIEEGAYMWRALLDSGAVIANGTDAPVEPVDPVASFFASVTRQTLQGMPPGGYEPAQKMTRQEALRSYTLNAAYAAFEEDKKGSIEAGKLADFTVFSQDLLQAPDNRLLDTVILRTIVGGKIVYGKLAGSHQD